MRCLFAFWFLVALVGCDSPASRLSQPPDIPERAHWPALDGLTLQREGMEFLIRSVGYGEFSAARSHLTGEPFGQLVSAFAAEAIPGKYASAEREVLKSQAVESLYKLISAAKEGAPDEELKTETYALTEALQELQKMSE